VLHKELSLSYCALNIDALIFLVDFFFKLVLYPDGLIEILLQYVISISLNCISSLILEGTNNQTNCSNWSMPAKLIE
jgi:hypothetical protein